MTAIRAGYSQGFPISKTIQTTVNGVDVAGLMEGSSFNIKITITSPYRNISKHWSIMHMLRGHRSFDGKYGEWLAKASLTDLYWLSDYVHRKSAMLSEKLQEHRTRKSGISEGWINREEFQRIRHALRNQLKSGEISNRIYQRRMVSMRREIDALQKQIWKLEDQFFEAYFPMSVSESLRQSIVDILDDAERGMQISCPSRT